MKKIGILTFHHGYNFGATLQTHGTYKFLEQEGYKPVVIDYINTKHHCAHIKSKLFRKNITLILKNLAVMRKFESFKSNWNLSKRAYDISQIDFTYFSAVVFGSDEIWNLNNPFIGTDYSYFGKRVQCPLIAYSPSSGNSISLTANREIRALLNSFTNISVRDENTREVVRNQLGKKVPITVDPIFLTGLDLAGGECNKNNFILYYGSNPSSRVIKEIKHFSRKEKKKIVAIGYSNPWADINLINLAIEDFVEFFKKADFVVTTSFHGVMFSLKFRKQFYVLSTAYKFNKIHYWLKLLNIDYRMIIQTENNIPLTSLPPIDYHKVSKSLNIEIIKSQNYLLKSLSKI